MLIGLTGQIGSGKTTVAGILRKLGAHIIDADQIGREVVEGSPALRRKLARAFGNDILTKRGEVVRPRLAERAFATDQGRELLNNLVHPYLLKELRRQARRARRKHNIVVIDAALLLDWEMDREVDQVLVVHAPEEDRLRRLASRGISRSDARARQGHQPPLAEYRRRADVILLNNGTIKELEGKVKRFWQSLTSLPD